MKTKCLEIGISIIAVVLLTLTSFTNVIGYQTIQSSNQSVIKERINQRELLFQTIVDIANNKKIQRIILKSQMSRGIFPTSEFPVVTKNQLKMMYFLGLILSKMVSKSRIQSIMGKYQFNNQEIQKEINAVIEKNAILNSEITQLKESECDCQDNNYEDGGIIIDGICIILLLFWEFSGLPIYILERIFPNTPLLVYIIGAPFLLISDCCWYLMMDVLNCYFPPHN